MKTSRRHSASLTILVIWTLLSCALFVLPTPAQITTHKPTPALSPDKQEASPEAPIGQVSPTSLNFGLVLVGQTSPQKRVRLTNTGDSELTISNISISGPFALPVNHCANGVKPGSHCDVYVTFTPLALETETGTLTFTDNAPNSPQTVSLTGTGANTVPTVTRLTATPKSILAGQPITLQATVASLGGGTIPDGEQVVFVWRKAPIGYSTLQSGVATLTTTAVYWFGQSEQKLTAQYAGDQSFFPSEGSTAVEVSRYPTTTTVSSNIDPSLYHETITVEAVVTSQSPYGVGGHVYYDGGPCPLEERLLGVPDSCGKPVDVGSYSVGARYTGDHYNEPGEASFTQVINPTYTTVSLKSSRNPSNQGQQVKFSVVVTAPYAHPVPGSVTFTAGANTLGTIQLVDARCYIVTSSLPVEQTTITATYNPPDGNYLSSSASLIQMVQ